MVGIRAGVPVGAALTQQVPAAVELHLHGTQALPVRLERSGVGTVGLLAGAQLVLLRHEPLDPSSNALVAHTAILRQAGGL